MSNGRPTQTMLKLTYLVANIHYTDRFTHSARAGLNILKSNHDSQRIWRAAMATNSHELGVSAQ